MKARLSCSPLRGARGFVLASLAVAVALPACGGSTPQPKADVIFTGTNNYTSQTSLKIPVVQTMPGADLMVCWNGLQKDLLCHDIVAPSNAIDNVGFAKIPNLDQTKVAMQLAVGTFDENLAQVYGDFHTADRPGSTCAMLSEMKLGEFVVPATDYVAPVPPATITYMLVFTSGTTPTVGTKSMLFLEPTAGNATTTVNAIDACAEKVLTFEATLGADIPIDKMDSTKWTVDWSQLTKDSFGNTIDFSHLKVDKVLLGFYQGKTKADLQTNFKDIEQIATSLYEVAVPTGARNVDLAGAKERTTGATFPGFTQTDGVWAVAVLCSKCQVPAPILLSIVTPQ